MQLHPFVCLIFGLVTFWTGVITQKEGWWLSEVSCHVKRLGDTNGVSLGDQRGSLERPYDSPKSGGVDTSCLVKSRKALLPTHTTHLDFSKEVPAGGVTLGRHKLDKANNEWGIPYGNSTLELNGKTLTYDDIVYGYDLIYEDLKLFTRTSWFGVPIQQSPQDAFVIAQLLWREQPDLVIEIGTNTGGGALFYAQVVREYNPTSGLLVTVDPKDPSVDWAMGTDNYNCPDAMEVTCSPLWNSKYVHFIKGFSTDKAVIAEIGGIIKERKAKKVLVIQDGSHFYRDVYRDVRAYDRFVTVGSYMVVQDTKMTRLYSESDQKYPLRVCHDFLGNEGKGRYVIDKQYEYLLYSQHHDGFLRKVRS